MKTSARRVRGESLLGETVHANDRGNALLDNADQTGQRARKSA
jgi:hypothetical protein